MKGRNIVLIVDDNEVDRELLKEILSDEYEILLTSNGRDALDILKKQKRISAIILDLLMPVMDGYEFLEQCGQLEELENIPVIVSTVNEDKEQEVKCLQLGAWDMVRKPYQPEIMRFRLRNAIERSELHVLQELRYREQYDTLTGLYKKEKFVKELKRLFKKYPTESFTMVHLDIYKFQLFNAFYGRNEGDRLLKFIADVIRAYSENFKHIIYCREEADVFNFCISGVGQESLLQYFAETRKRLNKYKRDYDIVPVFGVYVIEDRELPVNEMIDRAKLASKKCKGNYMKNYAFYEEDLEQDIVKEQLIVNNMNAALEAEEFLIYLQPKYDLRFNTIDGAEALIRWRNKYGQMMSPGEFIPVFERNGFIMKLDYYVWEHVCKLLRKWLNEGKKPYPISVNMSRVSLYNPNLVELICQLVVKYDIPPALLQLELTESAYTSNPVAIREAMSALQKNGFSILMDDFGSGYSSLNVLKDIAVDVLKIDMKFLADCDMPGRGENILASVIRMAKWLNMPVIAEGVEKREQVSFLRSIGCEYVQGYYYAKPMPVEEYEQLAFSSESVRQESREAEAVSMDSLWSSASQMELMFSNMLQAVAFYEYDVSGLDIIRVNNAYYDLFGYEDINEAKGNVLSVVNEDYRHRVTAAFKRAVTLRDVAECEFVREMKGGGRIWVNLKLKYINQIGTKHVVFGMLTDVTERKEIDRELSKYRAAVSTSGRAEKTVLIVDDLELARVALADIFRSGYRVLQAANGQQALALLRDCRYEVDLVLLDMIMPVMDGRVFLQKKQEIPEMEGIPIIIITADDSSKLQADTITMGVRDYITKPFVKEVVLRRVGNVLESAQYYGEILKNCK